jgi:molybdopterin molybdotransferase
MISFPEAVKLILSEARTLGVEKVPLMDADGRFLARPLKARLDMPRFDQSAMDGFAVKLADLRGASAKSPAKLILDGDVPAGSQRRPRLRRGHTVKVFTGSMLPVGTEAVVMREFSRGRGEKVLLEREASRGEHLRRRGEEFAKGDRLLEGGARIDPAVIGLLATFGHKEVPVFVRPTVTLLTIGDELVPLGTKLAPSKIYNSNELALTAALKRVGVGRIRAKTLPDDPAIMRREMQRGLRDSDVLVTAGGASVGDYDYLRRVAAECGIKEQFRAIAVKPGKPNFFGTWHAPGRAGGTRLVFGLPGNSVSALVSFHQLVRPALLKMKGLTVQAEPTLCAELTAECRKKPGRMELVRGRLESLSGRLLVHPTKRQGSHMMGGLAAADCLILFPHDRERLGKGETVEVQPLAW